MPGRSSPTASARPLGNVGGRRRPERPEVPPDQPLEGDRPWSASASAPSQAGACVEARPATERPRHVRRRVGERRRSGGSTRGPRRAAMPSAIAEVVAQLAQPRGSAVNASARARRAAEALARRAAARGPGDGCPPTMRDDRRPQVEVVRGADHVERRAHERALDDGPLRERAVEVRGLEPGQTRPEPDVRRRRLLRLEATDPFEWPARRRGRHAPAASWRASVARLSWRAVSVGWADRAVTAPGDRRRGTWR